MVKAGEVVLEVQVEHPVHTLSPEPDRERIQRVMRGASRPEPVRETEEVLLVDRVEHLHQRPLQELVLQRGDPERPLPPVRLGYVRPPRRLRPVAPTMHARVKILEVALEILPVLVPRHAVYPWRGLRPKREVRRP